MRIIQIAALAACLSATSALAYDKPVEKKVFSLPSYTTVGGKTIKDVKVGYETYGTLNAAGDNAVFVAHFYSSNSHAAGKYKETDAAPGYWNGIIGPGKSIDTDKLFVISADSLSNLNTKDPNTTTTGPSSINPDTGKIKAKILFVPASSDLVFPPEMSQKAAVKFRAQGGTAEVFVLEGDRGHLDGVIGIGKAAEAIRTFMNK